MASVVMVGVSLAGPLLVLLLFFQGSPLAAGFIDVLMGIKLISSLLAAVIVVGTLAMAWRAWSKGPGDGVTPTVVRKQLLPAGALLLAAWLLLFPTFPCAVPAVLTALGPMLLALRLHPSPGGQQASPGEKTASRQGLYVFAASATACFVIWVIWILIRLGGVEKWTDWTPAFRERVLDDRVTWKVAFVEWAMPLGIAAELGIIAMFMWLNSAGTPEHSGEVDEAQAHMVAHMRTLVIVLSCVVFVLWVTASLSVGPGKDLGHDREDFSDEVMGMALLGGLLFSAWLAWKLGVDGVHAAARKSKVAAQISVMMLGPWARAGYLFLAAPFLGLAWALQRFVALPAEAPDLSQTRSKAPKGQALDAWSGVKYGLRRFNERCYSELWGTDTLRKAVQLGIAYVSFQTAAKLTLLLLIYTNQWLSGAPLYLVAIAIFIMGTFLFLLPPTPGVPVYIVTGIVVTRSAQNAGFTFAEATLVSIFLGFAIKVSFVAVAQKFIGEPLAKSVKVRQLVQIHSVEMRAIELILKEPRITLAKVSILIGGPDWPVAVLCGILRLSLPKTLLGVSPVLVQSVVPCVLSGALYSGADDEETKNLAQTAVAIACALQGVLLLLCGYYIQQKIEQHYEELQVERPEDEDVLKLEREAEAIAKKWERQVEWSTLSGTHQKLLLTGLLLAEVACLLLVGPLQCFHRLEMTSTVESDLGGNPWNLVLPVGWCSLAFAAASKTCLALFDYQAPRSQLNRSPSSEHLQLNENDSA